jgi:hypothetical protein
MLGSHYRGLVGDESIGGDVAEALGGGIPGHAAGLVLNLTPAGLAINGADNAVGGAINTVGNMADSDEGERDDYWGRAKGAAGDLFDWIAD